MKIIKHKKQEEQKLYRQFACKKCGCVFQCEEDEYWKKPRMEYSLSSCSYSATQIYITCCPECHKIVEDEEYDTSIYSGNTITKKYVEITPTGTLAIGGDK